MTVNELRRPYTAESQNGAASHVNGDGVSNADLLSVLEDVRNRIAVNPNGVAVSGTSAASRDVEVEAVRTQIAQMDKTIDQSKREIAGIKHPQSPEDPVEIAASQLDAIVDATESATEDILDATEKIEDIVKRMIAIDPDNNDLVSLGDEVGGHLIRMMEACSFQDITGQRVTKVVKTLKFIEDRVAAIISIWGPSSFDNIPLVHPEVAAEAETEQALLNGPQLENEGISQDDIDSLFD